MALILTIDDDPDVLELLALMLNMHGHRVLQSKDGEGIIEMIMEHNPDLVIIDILMPGVSGGSVYQMIRSQIGPNLPVIISTGTKMKIAAPEDKMMVHCPKPVDQNLMLKTIDRLIAQAAKNELKKV